MFVLGARTRSPRDAYESECACRNIATDVLATHRARTYMEAADKMAVAAPATTATGGGMNMMMSCGNQCEASQVAGDFIYGMYRSLQWRAQEGEK